MNIKERIGQRIRQIREQKKMTQKDLSDLSDLDRSYITSVENGQRNISIVNITKIALALKVSLKDFFDNEAFNDNPTSGQEF